MAKCKYESHLDQEKCKGFERNLYGRCKFTKFCPLEEKQEPKRVTPEEVQETLDEMGAWGGTEDLTWPYSY